jgi:hypothetical protein
MEQTMRITTCLATGALVLLSLAARAEDKPDLLDRFGRAIQNNDDRGDRARDNRDSGYGASGYDRDRSTGRGYDRNADEQRRLDADQRDLDRRRRELDRDRSYSR